MVLKLLIGCFWLAGFFLTAAGDSDIVSDKKVRKAISRTWEMESFTIEPLGVKPEILAAFGAGNGPMIYEVRSQDSLAGYLYLSSAKGRYEYFDFLVLYDRQRLIRTIEILEYRSDHGFEITNRSWLAQFKGKTGCEAGYGKNIDAISGATLSASHLTEEIARMCEVMHFIIPPP